MKYSVVYRSVFIVLGLCLAQAFGEDDYEPVKADLPLVLYGDCDEDIAPAYIASGWMGNLDQIEMDQCCDTYPHRGGSCIKVTYNGTGGWAGVVWSDPPNDWGDEPGGWDLTGASNLTVWARGEEGGERVEFKMGILKRKRYCDSDTATSGRLVLTTAWKPYRIPLEGKDLRCIKSGFVWVVRGRREPLTFYIDDVTYR